MTKQKKLQSVHSQTQIIISLLAPDEFTVMIRTTTDEFNVIPRTLFE